MDLHTLIYATTRPAWAARLVVYIALIVTVSVAVQLLAWLV